MPDHRPPRDARRRAPTPLDGATLDALALGYVARYATTTAKLRMYLERKLRERGWAGETPAPVADVVARAVALGFVDDRAFAEMRSGALQRRGFGHRRIRAALGHAGIVRDVVDALAPDEDAALAAADTYAKRRRIGIYGAPDVDADTRRRQLAAMLRAGHDYAVARKLVDAMPDGA